MICEHGNEIDPKLNKAFCNMPSEWYRRVNAKLDPDVCLFVSEHDSLQKVANSFKKGK